MSPNKRSALRTEHLDADLEHEDFSTLAILLRRRAGIAAFIETVAARGGIAETEVEDLAALDVAIIVERARLQGARP
jgi:hypothetical protein